MLFVNYKKPFLKVYRRISLILWKNLILKKRHYILTAGEAILPIIFSVLMSYARTQVQDHGEASYLNFALKPETSLIEAFVNRCPPSKECVVAYLNNSNSCAEQIISELMFTLNSMHRMNVQGVSFHNAAEIEDYYIMSEVEESNNVLLVAIIMESNRSEPCSARSKISYTLRFPDFFNYTDELIPSDSNPGPNYYNEELYARVGFTGLQIIMDKIIIALSTGVSNIAGSLVINTQGFPYPAYSSSNLSQFYTYFLPQFVAQSYIFVVPATIAMILSEKETGVKELTGMMGLPNWMHWVGWALSSFMVPAISATLMVIFNVVSFHTNSKAVGYTEPTFWWIVIFLSILSGTSYCFFISSFFERPMVGIAVALTVWLLTYYAAVIPMESNYRQVSLASKMLLAISPGIAGHFSVKIRASFEATKTQTGWGQLLSPVSKVDSLCFGHIFLMMIISTILYMMLAIYFENVIPTTFGVPKPWNYLFKQFNSNTKANPKVRRSVSIYTVPRRRKNTLLGIGFEKDSDQLNIGIELKNLTKSFDSSKMAVENLSFKMFEGRITVIVGENGAGKTTTVSMLTGMYAPTSGTSLIVGHDVNTEMEVIRESLGYCPQQNMLFNSLTVTEHLIFFSRLKGLTRPQTIADIQRLLGKLQLLEKANTLSKSLSGGQKRKLSLACALIGGSKVIILDEPTSGMDPKACRAVWDLLLEMRAERTIVLTTQCMEEADVLADRIAILCDGKLQCLGSPMFLKKRFGDGYKLKLCLTSKTDPTAARILETVQKHVAGANFSERFISSDTKPEIWLNLPTQSNSFHSTTTVAAFPALFLELNELKDELGIESVGLSTSTMDEVFNRVVELSRLRPETTGVSGAEDLNDNIKIAYSKLASMPYQRFRSLVLKRARCLIRDRFVFICQLTAPILLIGLALFLGQRMLILRDAPSSLRMSLDLYNLPETLYFSNNKEFVDQLNALTSPGGQFVSSDDISKELLRIGEEDIQYFREHYVVAPSLTTDPAGCLQDCSCNLRITATAMFSTIATHSSPLALNLVTNAVLKFLNSSVQVETRSHPLQSAWKGAAIGSVDQIPAISAFFISVGMGLFAASFVVFPTEERLSSIKHLQLMTGTSSMCYWSALLCCDCIFSTIAIALMTACFPILEKYSTFSSNNGLGIGFLVFIIYAYGAIIFSYLVSLAVRSTAVGFAIITSTHLVAGMGFNIVMIYLRLANGPQSTGINVAANVCKWIFRLFPSYGSTYCIVDYIRIALANKRCSFLDKAIMRRVCELNNNTRINDPTLIHYRFCCENCADFKLDPCFSIQPYLSWENKDGSPGIGQELVYVFITAVLYATLLLSIEYNVMHKLFQRVVRRPILVVGKSQLDEDADVTEERLRVERILATTKCPEGLIVRGLCKKFEKSHTAVSQLSLGIKPGECFGLLGLNGAGKSTTFKMMTGDCRSSFGEVYGRNAILSKEPVNFLSQIGYCPQVDSLIGLLTGRENLKLFCQLRSVPLAKVDVEVTKWLTNTGLITSADIQCRNYSGGMKRRLCTALAMIGDSPFIVLDEPTSGVDPIARRKLWNIFKSATRSGQVIVMTSHSLEECEYICSRVGIMADGKLNSVGTVAQLKTKFTQGTQGLTIKFKYLIPSDASMQKQLDEHIRRCFQPCVLTYRNQNILQYELLSKEMSWMTLFQTLEGLRVQFPNFLDEYSVCESSLEQILLSMSSSKSKKGNLEAADCGGHEGSEIHSCSTVYDDNSDSSTCTHL